VITAHVDGGARGNPGPAGYGAVITDEEGRVLAELHDGIGIATNNVAEYRGLLAALQWALDHGHTHLHVKADSLLIVEQMRGNYRVKNEGLIPLHQEARRLAARIGRVSYEHVRREHNKDADRLSNLGMDLVEDVRKEERRTKNEERNGEQGTENGNGEQGTGDGGTGERKTPDTERNRPC
jgi:probable phosphoglycerate mutase